MKIYIASSWKNYNSVILLAQLFRAYGHEVDAFCEKREGRFVFSFNDLPNIESEDGISVMRNLDVQKAFAEDKRWIDWADAVLLYLPSGRSAHLEAGYAHGTGKKLYILGDFPMGEFDVMYGFADQMFKHGEIHKLLEVLDAESKLVPSG